MEAVQLSPFFLMIPVLLPVAGGGLLFLHRFREDRNRELYTEAVVCLTSVLVWTALFLVKPGKAEIYSFTGGFSVDFALDRMAALFAGMVSVMWPPVLLYAFEYMKEEKRKNAFFAFYVMTYGITLGAAFAGNMTTLYVFYEMLSLVTLPLVVHYGDHESMFAGRVYAAFTIGGAAAAFFPVVLTTFLTGGGDFAFGGCLGPEAVSGGLPGIEPEGMRQMLLLAFLFGFFGFGTKAAVFPLCRWLPLASAAPTPVTALLHAVAVVNSGVFAVTRVAWFVYGPGFLKETFVQKICLGAVCFTIVYAACMALKERHFKRRLAWSTVSNLSYMLFGIMLLTPGGLKGGLLHMLFHGVIKMSLFLCAGAFMHQTGRAYLYQVNGAGRKMPVTFFFYTLGALSLTGIPLFCGFVSKWALLTAAAGAGTREGITGLLCLIAAAFLCAVYTLTISARAFFPASEETKEGKDLFTGADGKEIREAGVRMLFPIVLFGIINLYFGLFPSSVLEFTGRIAEGL